MFKSSLTEGGEFDAMMLVMLYFKLYSILYCTVLYCTVLYCTVLYCTVLYCTVLYCTVLYRTELYRTKLYRTVLYSTLLYTILSYSFRCSLVSYYTSVNSPFFTSTLFYDFKFCLFFFVLSLLLCREALSIVSLSS